MKHSVMMSKWAGVMGMSGMVGGCVGHDGCEGERCFKVKSGGVGGPN